MRFKILIFFPLLAYASVGYHEPWGKDSVLSIPKADTSTYNRSAVAYIADKVILFHQKVISPVDGPRSHFRPTSSRYMQLAIRRYGFIKGFVMGCDRLLRENDDPWVYRTISIDGITYKWDPP